MLDLLKNDLKKFAIFVGSVSFGMLSYNFNFNFSNIMYLFVYFLIALVIYCFVGKTLKVGFENAIVETLLIVTIYMLPLDTSFKSFLYGVFIFISISSIFNKIREVGKGKEPVTGALYLLITLMIVLILYRSPGLLIYFRGMENINNEMLMLFGLVSLIGSI